MSNLSNDADQYPVYRGIWTNWSRGQILGLTLTLRCEEANLLIAFTAFFVAIVSSRFWRIICFAFHRQYATATQQDVVYHQRQAILRNSTTPEGGIQQLLQLIWVNRHRSERSGPIFIIIIAAVCIAAFATAGGLSSQISTAVGTEVLIQSLNCGYIDKAKILDIDPDGLYSYKQEYYILDLPIRAKNTDSAVNYAQQCYSNNTAGILDCGRFVTKKLSSLMDTKAACPFQDEICRSNSTNLRIDSGYIDSHKDLGVNSPIEARILVRNVLHCAPITTTGFTKDKNVDLGSDFLPIEPILRHDADVTVIFLSGGGVTYTAPSSDEWYRVSSTKSNISFTGITTIAPQPVYLPLEPSSPLGCTNQYQFCHRDNHHCGPLASIRDAISGAANISNTTHHESTGQFNYLIAALNDERFWSLGDLIEQLGWESLTSKTSLSSGFQGPLPSNQWQLDVIHWSEIAKASMQAALLHVAYFDPPDPPALEIRKNFTFPDNRSCNNQKIRSTAHASFSLFGLLFTFVVGSLIILTSYLLEPVSKLLYKKWGCKTYAYLEWTTNSTLQLQRLAHEELALGTWSKGTGEVPTTEPGDLLGCLDISNPDHPVLIPPRKEDTPEAATPTHHHQTDGVSSLGSVNDEVPPNHIGENAPQISFLQLSPTESLEFGPGTEIVKEKQDNGPETQGRPSRLMTI
ncbi:hypothetical protein HD806DRAFT_547935 [Xylariaceae sp. AK1471]|nr:hypothetical protein HD806DRAFT_547935 [Xylariaceae sp. AK1471]